MDFNFSHNKVSHQDIQNLVHTFETGVSGIPYTVYGITIQTVSLIATLLSTTLIIGKWHQGSRHSRDVARIPPKGGAKNFFIYKIGVFSVDFLLIFGPQGGGDRPKCPPPFATSLLC